MSNQPTTRNSGSWVALRHRQFAFFFAAASISNAASWMQSIAVPALLYDLTGKATWLGVAAAVSMLPAVIITPYAGVLADRVSRRKILIVTQSVQMCASGLMVVLYVGGHLTPWPIITIGFVNGVATGFQTATWQSFVPSLVPPEHLLDAVRLNSMQFTVARALGPAAAGIVVATAGVGWAIFLNAITYVFVLLALVVAKPHVGPLRAVVGTVGQVLREGARFVFGNPALRLACGLAFLTAFCGQSLMGLAAAISKSVYGHSSKASAGLLTALGIGSLLSSGLGVSLGQRLTRSRQAAGALVVYSTAIAIMAATTNYWVGMVGFFLAGAAHLQMAMALNTLLQGEVPDQFRGRTMSFYILGVLGGIPLGSLLFGRLGDTIGVRAALVVDAVIMTTVLVVVLARRRLPLLDQSLADLEASMLPAMPVAD